MAISARRHWRRRRAGRLGLQGAVAFELFSKPEPVAAADLKVDGHITLAEFLTAASHDFDTLDPTGRGYLTLADLPKTPLQAALEGRQARASNSVERLEPPGAAASHRRAPPSSAASRRIEREAA